MADRQMFRTGSARGGKGARVIPESGDPKQAPRPAQYQRLLKLNENNEIREMEQTWLGKAEAQGMKKGLIRGREEGLAQGKEEAKLQYVDRMRHAVLQLVKGQFGRCPGESGVASTRSTPSSLWRK